MRDTRKSLLLHPFLLNKNPIIVTGGRALKFELYNFYHAFLTSSSVSEIFGEESSY